MFKILPRIPAGSASRKLTRQQLSLCLQGQDRCRCLPDSPHASRRQLLRRHIINANDCNMLCGCSKSSKPGTTACRITRNRALISFMPRAFSKFVEMLECKRCVEISKQMMLMIIICQKVTKTFGRLVTMLVAHNLSVFLTNGTIPLPQLVLIQQLRLERALSRLKVISRSRNWKTHLAMLKLPWETCMSKLKG